MIKIWNRLMRCIGNEYAVAGIMGNLEAESALKSNNLQNSYEKIIGMNDTQYTNAVNNKNYSRGSFYSDHAGYGLAQWTYWSRKAGLYDFIFSNGYNDISSEEGQLDFLYKELKENYSGTLKKLLMSSSVREASDIFCKEYENPANQSEPNLQARANKGQKWYDMYHGSTVDALQEEMEKIYQCLIRMGFKK